MSLFKVENIKEAEQGNSAYSIDIETEFLHHQPKKLAEMNTVLGDLLLEKNLSFCSNGSWNNIDLLGYILKQTGPAKVHFSTWAISIEAIRSMLNWQYKGLITHLSAVFDKGLRNRKPEVYQQIIANFKNFTFSKCHAKVFTVTNDAHFITVIGSANFTTNPRLEAGVIIKSVKVASENIAWINHEIYGNN